MQNKILINKLKENAELAMAAYGYFHLADSKYDFNKDEIDKRRLKEFRKRKDDEFNVSLYPTPTDILNIEYKYFKDKNDKPQDSWYHKHFLDGDFTPTQAKRFLERYELIHHIPNTLSGFSATIFYDIKESNTTTNTKEFKKHFEYIIAFRDTESTKEIV